MLVEIDIHISIRIHGYDNWGQLLTESGTVSGFPEAPYSYSNAYQYDSVGNIKSFSDGTTTHTYAYEDADWKDLLTSYDGQSITYDSNGNPTSYFNGNRWTFGWENGRQLTTLSKQAPVIITTQPENFFGTAGSTATFTVKAEGDRVTYQWQRSKDEGKTWTDISGETSETLNVTIQSSDFGSQYRCIAKDFMGHVATSQAGKLASSIASQSAWDPEYTIINEPDDYYGRPGDIATFIVEAEGKNLSYQWLYQAPGSDEFVYCTSSDATTNTLRVEMTAESDGAQYRCFITDANGDMGSTRCATVKLDVRDWTMEYEAGGLRTKRSSAEKTYNYIYSGDKLVRMTCGDNILDFTYDANGAPLTLIHNGTVYYYITNLQGDVISLETMDGMLGAHYYYDAWGKILACDGAVAELNPLRYRGYVYDQETGFYYLQSRYYDPAVARFLNADSYISTGDGVQGNNMFAYCNNNPTNMVDGGGTSATAFQWWSSTMWWLCGADAALPIGDAIYGLGMLILGGAALYKRTQKASTITARSKSDENSNALSSAKDYARSIFEPGNRYAVHHIVAQASPHAAPAREVLKSVGINPVTYGLNLAVIPEKKHYSLHTIEYYNYINRRLENLTGDRNAIMWTLAELHIEIQLYCQTGLKAW